MPQTVVVTGAGSGVGQALAVMLAQAGWRVALVGRREAALRETVAQAGQAAGQMLVCPCDIRQVEAVQQMAEQVHNQAGFVQVLVNSAGTNTPRRSLAEVSLQEYRRILDTNLNGAYYCVQAFLPAMRTQGQGTIVNIVSDAGRRASPKAGAAYAISKFGMAGLTQTINAEEREHGIRACSIFPGDIATPLLEMRPVPPSAEARRQMLQAGDVAACALLAITLPARAIVEELVIRPR